MQEMKQSKLLQELFECQDKKSSVYTIEELFVNIIDRMLCDEGDNDNEELLEIKRLFCSFIHNLDTAKAYLKERIKGNEFQMCLAAGYSGVVMAEVIEMCKNEGRDCITTVDVLKIVFAEPSAAIKAVMNDKVYSVKFEMAKIVEETRDIRAKLKSKVFGQDNAIDIFVTGYFKARMLALTDEERYRPKATFLFAGPPGVGKTFLAESVADALNMKSKFKVFDMSEYSDKEAAIEFTGSDAVYRNSKGGNLTTFVEKNPECVLLFDEIEKAHISIIHLFLQILDAGRIRDSKTDKEISLKDAIIIFTTNAGKQLYEETEADLSLLQRNVILNALRNDINPVTQEPYFPAAICSRFASGNVVMFNHMKAQDLFRIVKEEILENIESIKRKTGIDIKIQEDVYTALLFSEGGNVDARTIKSRAESFINNELYELWRLIDTEKVKTTIDNIESIKIEVDLKESDNEIKSLFDKDKKNKILVLASDKTIKLCQKKLTQFEVVGVKNKIDAVKEIKKTPIDIALIDIKYSASGKIDSVLNIEDIKSPGREFLKFLQEQRNLLPVFLIEEKTTLMTEEEKESFLKQGIRDILKISGKKNAFAEKIKAITTNLYQQACLIKLAGSKKTASFETSQTVSKNGKIARIKLFDFKLSVAVDSEDSRDVLSDASKLDVKFEDIIGADDAKKELKFSINYLKNPYKYTGTGLKAPRGILLYGPSGTGKTMLARAMASEAGVAFIATEGNDFLKNGIQGGPARVHEIFRRARKYAPSILFIDEIDTIAKERNAGNSAESIVTAFLTEMDGFSTDPSRPVFVLAATNYTVEPGTGRSLDSALMRRFDKRIYIELPDKVSRSLFLKKKTNENSALKITDPQIDSIVLRSTGMSLAELDSVVELALRSAIREGKTTVNDSILEEAFEEFNGGEVRKWDETLLERVARHEAGHALLCWHSGETPTYVTIVARENHGGYMQHAENENKPFYTKKELLSRIRTTLGGKAAELVYYGENDGVSTCARADLASASKMAKNFICTYGMDDDFGMDVLCDGVTADSVLSIKIHDSINKILKQEMIAAKEVVEQNKYLIDALVDALLNKNYLNEAEIKAVLSEGKMVKEEHIC